jgi:PIN domain nuclease of toxin-antitoxin system
VILLDTHIGVWWVDGSPSLTAAQRQQVEDHEATGLG